MSISDQPTAMLSIFASCSLVPHRSTYIPKAPKSLSPTKIPKLPPNLASSVAAYFNLRVPKCSLRDFSYPEAFSLVCRTRWMRRDALLGLLLPAVTFPSFVMESSAESDQPVNFRAYEDETNKFRILVPEGWLGSTTETSNIKSVTAFYPKEPSTSNVSIAITGLGPDFTTLGSFGKVDAFAENLVNGLDRSWQRPPGLVAKLINSAAANGLYYIEYTLQNPGEGCRHIFSAIGIAFNGWYNRLYTVTGQFVDDEADKYQSLVEKSVSSFRLI